MARYVTTVRTRQTPAEAFAYMADLRNFALWDPGVKKVVQVKGAAGGADAAFDVTVSGTTLRYVTEVYEPNTTLLVVAKSRTLKSTDRVTVVADGTTTLVTYDALLELNGVLAWLVGTQQRMPQRRHGGPRLFAEHVQLGGHGAPGQQLDLLGGKGRLR